MKERDAEKLVLLNAAAAIYVAGNDESLRSGYSAALESVRSGAAQRKLIQLSELAAV
jgi:anthranilate phosphoribosyltransferase